MDEAEQRRLDAEMLAREHRMMRVTEGAQWVALVLMLLPVVVFVVVFIAIVVWLA